MEYYIPHKIMELITYLCLSRSYFVTNSGPIWDVAIVGNVHDEA